MEKKRCAICGCKFRDNKGYGTDDPGGRSHSSKSHYIAERLFGRTKTGREPIFKKGKEPWGVEGKFEYLCYDCHEELLQNPVLLPEDIKRFKDLVERCGLGEDKKRKKDKDKLAGRIILLHEVIATGIKVLHDRT